LHVSLTIPLSSYLTGLSQVPRGYNDPDVDGPRCMLTSTSVNKSDEMHKCIIVNNHECPTDHEYVVVRVIANQSRLRGLCSRNGPKVTLTYFSMFLNVQSDILTVTSRCSVFSFNMMLSKMFVYLDLTH
jgi:hypothetical protein